MQPFFRAVRLASRYRGTIWMMFLSALMLALCWGINISTVYPLIQIPFQGKTFATYWNEQIETGEQRLQNDAASATKTDAFSQKKHSFQQELFKKTRPWIERHTPTTPFKTIAFLLAFLAIVTAFKTGMSLVHHYFTARLRNLSIFELRNVFFDKTIRFEVNYFHQQGVADLMSRFSSDMAILSNGIAIFYKILFSEPLKLVVGLTGAALISWPLLCVTFLFVPILLFTLRRLSRKLKVIAQKSMKQNSALFRHIHEIFHAIKIVKIFHQEKAEGLRFRRINREQFRCSMKLVKYHVLTNPINELMRTGTFIVMILIGSYLVLEQQTSLFGIPLSSQPFSLGGMVLFFGFLLGAASPAKQLSEMYVQLQDASAAAYRIFEIIDREVPLREKALSIEHPRRDDSLTIVESTTDPTETPQASASKPTRNNAVFLQFEHVSFAYDLARQNTAVFPEQEDASSLENLSRTVLNDVSLDIGFGETIALVGASGCGKSTLLNLIPRFFDPSQGQILLDGTPLPQVPLRDLRKQIGLVTQSPILFNRSVRENLGYGSYGISQEDIIDAAKKANAHDFITNDLAHGYETLIGPNGNLLSGGQRQRLAIARALLSSPKILLMDEATSQIDMQSEALIHESLKKIIGTRTTILVSHRWGALMLADRVVVMKNGQLHAIGTHVDLVRTCPYYHELFAQFPKTG